MSASIELGIVVLLVLGFCMFVMLIGNIETDEDYPKEKDDDKHESRKGH